MPSINRLQSIWTGLASNNRWSAFVSDEDVKTFSTRAEAEGPEFYARNLGALRKDILTGFGQMSFVGTSRFGVKRNSVLPRFMHGALSQVFNSKTGTLLPCVNVDAVACVNQLSAVFTKVKGGHTPQSECDVIQSFLNTEAELQNTEIDLSQHVPRWRNRGHSVNKRDVPLEEVLEVASDLVRRVLAGSDPREISPKHGSGVSACRTVLNRRYGGPRYVDKINAIWPMDSYYYASPTAFCDGMNEFLESPGYDPCAKVLLVPKDARGPRLISCEPRETMWIQQGLMASLYEVIEAHSLTRGRVNFTRQGENQLAAYAGSIYSSEDDACTIAGNHSLQSPSGVIRPITWLPGVSSNDDAVAESMRHSFDARRTETSHYLTNRNLSPARYSRVAGKLATLDLKDASDRVRLDLVCLLFPENWSAALLACRSDATELPDGTIVPLSKHAPMGSATCFPVMALTIWSILTAIAPMESRKDIMVYGDDIIVPSFIAGDATRVLEAVGLRVNVSKSFSHGPFRESCGEEFYDGCRVTPVYLRMNPDDDATSRMSLFAFCNNLLQAPTVTDTGWMLELLQNWYGNDIPIAQLAASSRADWFSNAERAGIAVRHGLSTLSGVVYTDDPNRVSLPSGKARRVNTNYQVREYSVTVPVPRCIKYSLDDWCHVLRALVNPKELGLGVDAVNNRVRYCRRWCRLD